MAVSGTDTKIVNTLSYLTPEPNGKEKIEGNINNDLKKHYQLREAGYKVIVIWGCELKNKTVYNRLIDEIDEIKRKY